MPKQSTDGLEFIGELALDGQLRPTTGTLSIAIACQQAQHCLVLPEQNAQEAAQLPDFEVFAATHLKQVCEHLAQSQLLDKVIATAQPQLSHSSFDLVDVKGQLRPRRALEIAAAGGHSLLFKAHPVPVKPYWHPGTGILPPLNMQENLEVASIYSVANSPHTFGQRPFRAPHHTASAVALVGGGCQFHK